MSAHAGTIDHHHDHTTVTGIPNKKLFMWAFLASDCMFFGALISTHVIYRLHPTPDGTTLGAPSSPRIRTRAASPPSRPPKPRPERAPPGRTVAPPDPGPKPLG